MMTRLFAAAACAATLGCASAALADGQVTATFDQPVATAKLVVGGAVWHCGGNACVAATAPDHAGSVDSCKQLAHQVGHVSAYEMFKPLDEKGLASCNVAAAGPKTSATASR
ncbi:MAG TPA: hypothetical protein VG248_04240 [Caulobacteraceae bacterium]|jgi:hypothetical protein|nr:hypothetical protein [Caulobacteraceae bacterium]